MFIEDVQRPSRWIKRHQFPFWDNVSFLIKWIKLCEENGILAIFVYFLTSFTTISPQIFPEKNMLFEDYV